MEDKDLLKKVRDFVHDTAEHERDNRKFALEDTEFAMGNQWPANIKAERDAAGLPCLVFNRLNGFIDRVVGDQRQNRPSIKVHPKGDGASQDTAELLQGLIRNIEYDSLADVAYDNAFQAALIGGFPGYMRVVTEYATDDAFEQDIRIKPIYNNFSVYMDPHAKEPDKSDAMECAVTELIPRERFEDMYPDVSTSSFDDPGENSKTISWSNEDTVRICEYWWREPSTRTIVKTMDGKVLDEDDVLDEEKYPIAPQLVTDPQTGKVKTRKVDGFRVKWIKCVAAEILEEGEWAGDILPFVAVDGKVINHEGKEFRYGLIRFAKDPQRAYNFHRTKTTELLALAPKVPWIGTKKNFEGFEDKWAKANRSNDAYLPFNPDEKNPQGPRRTEFPPVPTGLMQEGLACVEDLKATTGLFDASLGQFGKSDESGTAILAHQRQSEVSTFPFVDNLSRGIRLLGRILVNLIPKVYDTDRIVRIMKEDGDVEAVEINKRHPWTLEMINDLTTGKYDVTIDTGPSYQTQRLEAANAYFELFKAFPPAAQALSDMAMRNLDVPQAKEAADRLQALLPPPIQAMIAQKDGKPPPQQQGQGQNPLIQVEHVKAQAAQIGAQADMAKAQAEIEKAKIQLQGQQVDLEGKRIELQSKQVDLDIKRHHGAAAITQAAFSPPISTLSSTPDGVSIVPC